MAGSKNQKLSTKDRPNRLCHTLSAPEALAVATVDFLNKIAGTAIVPTEEPSDPQIDFAAIPEGDRKEQIEMVIAYLAEFSLKPTGLANFIAKQTGEAVKPDPVSSGHVRETMAAIQSLCKHRVSKKTQPPFWLSPHDDWQAGDMLIFRNGLLNVRHWLAGKECFIPKTPRLFYQYQAPFEYVAQPAQPAVWHAFLDSLDQREDWRLQLQQMMGYLLWLGFDLQKFFHLFGPPRAGKGIIVQVASDMGGGACTITLDGFCDSFGLEKAVGQRLILVGETEKGPTKYPVAAVVGAIRMHR